jgi:Autophagocytosis associated protein, active-site domain
MSRSVIHIWRSQPLAMDELPLDGDLNDACLEDDASVLSMSDAHESLIAQQYVVYSATFQVPAFYFTLHNSRLWLR